MTKFTWGDTVRVSDGAPANARPGSTAEVVGVSEQQERDGSYRQQFPTGVVYTVEFDDGTETEVHEDYLARIQLKTIRRFGKP